MAMVEVVFWSVCLFMLTFFISSSRYHVFVHVCMIEVFLVILTFEMGVECCFGLYCISIC